MDLINFDLLEKIDNKNKAHSKDKANSKNKNRHQLALSAFENNLFQISEFLDQQSRCSLKLTCRLFHYTFISHDIWQGIKHTVAEKKVEFYQDIDFIQQEPLKNVNKEERKIRIHSLKKNNLNNRKTREPSNVKNKAVNMLNQQMLFRNTEIGFKKLLKPQSSLAQKPNGIRPSLRRNSDKNKDTLEKVQTSNKYKITENNVTSQKTQAAISYKHLFQLIQLPSEYTEKDLIIKVSDPWHVNMNRANNLISILKRWNQFHVKRRSFLDSEILEQKNQNFGEDSFGRLIKFVRQTTELQKMTDEYRRIFCQSANLSYRQIVESIQSAKSGLLINQNLNKVAKKFLEHHSEFMEISQQISPFINNLKAIIRNFMKVIGSKTANQDQQQLDSTISSSRVSAFTDAQSQLGEKSKSRIVSADSGAFSLAQYLNCLDDSVSILSSIAKEYPTITKFALNRLVFIFDGLVESLSLYKIHRVILSKISFNTVCKHAQDFQLIFQLFSSAYTKLTKLATTFEQQQLVLAMVLNKFKAMRKVSAQLWNVAKYFKKLNKQVEKAEKKLSQKDIQKLKIIQDFLKSYSEYRTQFQIFNFKNLPRLEKQMSNFKQKVSKLKSMIQNND